MIPTPWLVGLLVWCACLAWSDIRSRRIPNALLLAGFAAALFGIAFRGQTPLGATPLQSITGALLGLVVLMPLYVARVMGAGDIKLLATIGALMGVWALLPVWLIASVVAGMHALIWVSSAHLMPQYVAARPSGSFGRLPFGAHLSLGIVIVAWRPNLMADLSFGLMR